MNISHLTGRSVLLLAVFLVPLPARSQTNATDSQNLHALLEEVRELRRDIETTTIAAQRTQILLYRLQLQGAAVTRATNRSDQAHRRLESLAAERRNLTSEMQSLEDSSNDTQESGQGQGTEQAMSQMKRRATELTIEEQTWQVRAADADEELRVEKAKLDSLNSQLDQLERDLENATNQMGSAHRN